MREREREREIGSSCAWRVCHQYLGSLRCVSMPRSIMRNEPIRLLLIMWIMVMMAMNWKVLSSVFESAVARLRESEVVVAWCPSRARISSASRAVCACLSLAQSSHEPLVSPNNPASHSRSCESRAVSVDIFVAAVRVMQT